MSTRKRTPNKFYFDTAEESTYSPKKSTTPKKYESPRKRNKTDVPATRSIPVRALNLDQRVSTSGNRLTTRSMTTPTKCKTRNDFSPVSSPRKPCLVSKQKRTPNKKTSISAPSNNIASNGAADINQKDNKSLCIKLLGRSLNISPYVDTPLYPLCRSWMENDTKSDGKLIRKSDLFGKRKYNGTTNGSSNWRLPRPNRKPVSYGTSTMRIPSPILFEKQIVDLDYENKSLPSKEELLANHRVRWREVRKKWKIASFDNELRYLRSKEMLKEMFKKYDLPS